ncbi:MAG: caspase family protein [Humidesulfovibrio sp.]|nr:caspase family protein [Humidesulfovibrio sp.]
MNAILPPASIRALWLALVLSCLCGCAGLTANCVSGDCVNGQGTVLGFGGWSYAGEFRAGQAQGKGTFTWMDGTRFDGMFEGGRRVGPGVLTRTNGQVVRGVWNDVKGVGYQTAEEASAALPQTQQPALAGKSESAAPPHSVGADLAAERERLAEELASLKRQKAELAATSSLPGQPPRPKASGPVGRRVALVIGNSAYPTAPLKNPVNDARDMASALKSLGFEVILRENASLAQREDAVDEFWGRLKKGGAGLFYFAGHGLQVHGKNYLVPVDARLSAEQDAKYRCMDAGLVLGRMEDAGNGLNIVILDACRNNPFARSFRSADQGLAKMDAPTGSLVAFATAPGDIAADGAGKNGLYTSHLLRHLRSPGLTIENVLKQTRIGVAADSAKTGKRQTPWESSSLMGDFYFTPGNILPPSTFSAPSAPPAPSTPAAHAPPVSGPVSGQVSSPATTPLQTASLPPAQAVTAPASPASTVEQFFGAGPGPANQQQSPQQSPQQNAGTDSGRRNNNARPDVRVDALANARKDALLKAATQAVTQTASPARPGAPQAWLGLHLADVNADSAKALGLGSTAGAFVQEVVPGSPAQAAGLQAGDVVLTADGLALGGPKDLAGKVASASPGSVLRLGLWRQRQMREVAAILTPQTGQAPAQLQAPAQIQAPAQAADLDQPRQLAGLKVRLIYTDDRLGDAQNAKRALEAQGMTVDMFPFTKNDSYKGHIGKLYAVEGYVPLAQALADVVRPIENTTIFPNPVKASSGQQFNLWIAR